ncbi:hypothetical protein Trydic_g15018 [Trypoxylus dichotomus]
MIVNVIALPKIRKQKDSKDLRPISILLMLKILEKVCQSELEAYLLADTHLNFRPGCSATALAYIADNFSAIDDNRHLLDDQTFRHNTS